MDREANDDAVDIKWSRLVVLEHGCWPMAETESDVNSERDVGDKQDERG